MGRVTARRSVTRITVGERVIDRYDTLAAEEPFFTTSSCGLRGKASIDAVRTRSAYEVRDDALRGDSMVLYAGEERVVADERDDEGEEGHAA